MSVLNLPSPVGRAPWSSHTKTLLKAANELWDTELSNAALEVKRFKIANGSLAVGGAKKSDRELRELVVEAGASIDGSWSSRGTTSRRQYLEWYLAHEENCFMNHEDSAQVSFHFYCNFVSRL